MALNDAPVGTVTKGLPDPFLNNMEAQGRIVFYGISTGANLVFMMIGWGLAWMLARRVGA